MTIGRRFRIGPASHHGMQGQIVGRTAVILIGCLLLPSCAHFTQSGRQQAAYSKYVKKQSQNRVRQQTKFKKIRVPSPGSSEPKEITGASQGPQSVSSGESLSQ